MTVLANAKNAAPMDDVVPMLIGHAKVSDIDDQQNRKAETKPTGWPVSLRNIASVLGVVLPFSLRNVLTA
jgi:hypothetical protein